MIIPLSDTRFKFPNLMVILIDSSLVINTDSIVSCLVIFIEILSLVKSLQQMLNQ